MKQLFAYTILFCLVFLNVPRSLVHECDHDSPSAVHSHEEDEHSEDRVSFEQDDCFTCEFQLDAFNCPSPFLAFGIQRVEVKLTESVIERISSDQFDYFSLRGPPLV